MAEDGPPPLQGENAGDPDEARETGSDPEDDDEEDYDDDDDDDDDDGDDDDEWVEEDEVEDDDDDEAPPPMWGDSGSEAEEEVPVPPKTTKKASTAGKAGKKVESSKPSARGAGGGRGGAGSTGGAGAGASSSASASARASTGASKPAAAAGSSKSAKDAGGKKGKGKAAVSPLWIAFEKSRNGAERLGITPLKKWESFVKDMPTSYMDWYTDQILGTRSVPQALRIAGLPDGFPEFCHWVAAGHHNACDDAHLKPGFEPFAVNHVKMVEHEVKPVGRSSTPSGLSTSGSGRGGTGPVSEARKRDRRSRTGGGVANGTDFALKMQSAITELEGFENEGSYSAAFRAIGAGHRAEDEVRHVLGGDVVLDEEAMSGEALGPSFADSKLPSGTLDMLSHLKRARAYRRRSERQQDFVERELERCLCRLARVEGQYLALVAETSGKESSLKSCVDRARSVIDAAYAFVGKGLLAKARDQYDIAVKLLEVHLDEPPAGGETESSESKTARKLLEVALCNRSVACYRLGDAYSGKQDAERALSLCPGQVSQEQFKRSELMQQTLNVTATASSQWLPFATP